MQNDSIIWNFSYDADGLRTGRNYGSTNYTYRYVDGKLTQMYYIGTLMRFTYGADGRPMSITYDGTVYYYVLNLQGDVVAILDSSGEMVVEYVYDAWGRVLSTTGSKASSLGLHNPLRYRGYVYDRETGLYYLQSRYYNPNTGRFLNADGAMPGAGGEITGYNMFAYCFNNPVNMSDPNGHWPQWLINVANWLYDNIISPVAQVAENVAEDCQNYNPNNESEEEVFSSNYFSSYKGSLVIKTPFDASFSFGVIGLSHLQQNSDTLKHEYGHTVQMDNMGIIGFAFNVAIPSLTINILARNGKLKYDYYGAPWEAEADMFGGVNRTYDNTPWPEGAYNSYYDLIKMFWQ